MTFSLFISLLVLGLVTMYAVSNITCDNPITKKDCENTSVLGNVLGFLFIIIALLVLISDFTSLPEESKSTGRKTPI